MPEIKVERENILTEMEIEAMIYKAKEASTRGLIAFLWLFGVRISEALSLRFKDIRVGESYVIVRIRVKKRRKKSGLPFIHEVKIKRTARFMDFFVSYLKHRRYVGDVDDDRLVFNFSRSTAWRRIKKLNPDSWLHLFRHSRLTMLAEKGATPAQLMIFAGWSDTRPTGAYLHRTKQMIDDLADKVD